jgi:ribosomal-protein-alanine N-acetyltransferase
MSAVLKDEPVLATMVEADLREVLEVERAVYTHPWTHGNMSDSLRAGYQCRTLRVGGTLAGYFILIVAAGEAHLLNLSVAAAFHRLGHGEALLAEVMRIAANLGGRHLFLEVRPSNPAAQALYAKHGFRKIAVRRDYYPASQGREDALVYMRKL